MKAQKTLCLAICFYSLVFGGVSFSAEPAPGTGKLTEKQAQELNRFKKRDALINPLQVIPGAPNRFDKDTLYVMKNFKIVQKVQGGYFVTADPVVWEQSGHVMEFAVAYLKTQKKLTPDLLISGAVYYAGEYKYTGMNGFSQRAPMLKIPAGLPLSAIRQGGDPFSPEYF